MFLSVSLQVFLTGTSIGGASVYDFGPTNTLQHCLCSYPDMTVTRWRPAGRWGHVAIQRCKKFQKLYAKWYTSFNLLFFFVTIPAPYIPDNLARFLSLIVRIHLDRIRKTQCQISPVEVARVYPFPTEETKSRKQLLMASNTQKSALTTLCTRKALLSNQHA
ncbi:hypothetical protein BT63DRAFT_160295 [Microthyrium microscopicum]|uniref:Uncharacterized protein n=1 Tax=Microthyrium microscopicum TaxID=703497 RepID=A0A6A6UMR5_9PEZI|nr:hypothetical protein BT63DRAFT_160295 [Microthyrium microscopicum]